MVFLSPSNHFKWYLFNIYIYICFYTFTFVIEVCHFTNFIDILQCDSCSPSTTVRIHLLRDVLLEVNVWMNHIGLGYKPPVCESRDVDPSVTFCVSSLEKPSDLCRTLSVCDDRTAWRWSAVLAQKCDGWKSLCGRGCLVSTVSWFEICRTMSYLKLDTSKFGLIY